MTNIDRNVRSQRGVALLFALGVLSLMLVTGIAFLGNVLITQKIVTYRAEASSAKHLLATAQERALAHLNIFNLTQVARSGIYYAGDASSVYSRMDSGVFNSGTAKTSIAHDQLYADNETDSLLSVKRSKFSSPSWYNGAKSMAQWIYVHQDGTFSNGSVGNTSPIIGRYAYQVLPQTSNSRLALYAATAGGKVGGIAKLGSEEANTYTRLPQKHRWGLEIDELNIIDKDEKLNNMFYYWTFKRPGTEQLCDPVADFDIFTGMLSGNAVDGGKEINALYDDDIKTENRKRWLEHLFVEGKGRVAREAYPVVISPDTVLWFPRFNLSEHPYGYDFDKNLKIKFDTSLEPWYRRFVDPTADADEQKKKIAEIQNIGVGDNNVIDKLTAVPGRDNGRFSDTYFAEQHTDYGLPFLRRIGHGSEKGGFDKIEYLRKQIAANLNDYCDADYIPTSDVKAVEWLNAVTGTGTVPLYTGNEQTPYINEVGFGFKVGNSKFTTNGSEYKFSTEIESEVLVELIKVYQSLAKNQAGTALTAADLIFQGKVNDLALTLKLELKGKVTFYQTKDGVESKIGETTDFTLNDVEHTATLIDSSNRCNLEIDKGGFSGDGPYWVKSVPLQFSDAAGGKVKNVEIDLTEKLKSAYSFDGAEPSRVAVELDNVKVGLTKVEFNFGNLVLLAPDWASGSTSTVGIDFAAMENKAGTKHLCEPASAVTLCDGTEANFNNLLGAGYFSIAYFGSMEARDPRQNLNARFDLSTNNDNCTNDWDVVDLPSLTFVAGAVQSLSTTSSLKWDDLTTRITGGKVNSVSNPSKTDVTDGVSANPLSRIDKETATDPAWKGDDAGQHISTAVIRNAPMRSPWELGFIHRGIPFQTINLKKAGGIDGGENLAENAHDPVNFKEWSAMAAEEPGTQYQNGDAGILDQIKMTPYNKSYGKVDFSALKQPPVNWITTGAIENFSDLSNEILKALFAGVKPYKPWEFVEYAKNLTDKPGWPTDKDAASVDDLMASTVSTAGVLDSALRSRVLTNLLASHISAATLVNDAAKEELIGKTVNLTEGRSASVPNVFKIVVVAQMIKDLEGNIGKRDFDDNLAMAQDKLGKVAAIGSFDAVIDTDPDKSIYFDEIWATSRMLVTVEKIHYLETVGTAKVPRARLRVKQIEYLD